MAVVMADPTDVRRLDELELLLGQPVEVRVGARSAIEEILQKSESAQRVLDEATEDFRIQLVQDEGDDRRCCRSTASPHDQSPIIKLVDSTIFNAIQRRASDIHIETGENEVMIKYRIDGVLYQAMDAIDKQPPPDDHQPHQGDVGAGHLREARPPGRPLQAAAARAARSTSASRSCPPSTARTRHPRARQGVDQQGVQEPLASTSWASATRPSASSASRSASPTAWCW